MGICCYPLDTSTEMSSTYLSLSKTQFYSFLKVLLSPRSPSRWLAFSLPWPHSPHSHLLPVAPGPLSKLPGAFSASSIAPSCLSPLQLTKLFQNTSAPSSFSWTGPCRRTVTEAPAHSVGCTCLLPPQCWHPLSFFHVKCLRGSWILCAALMGLITRPKTQLYLWEQWLPAFTLLDPFYYLQPTDFMP